MYNINLYTDNDINKIIDNLDYITDLVEQKKLKILEPTIDEYNNVIKEILNFIKKKKRIIYGGYAWELLVKNANSGVGFYKKNDMPDVEFYSTKPIEDLKELCDILYKNNKYVQGKNAQHSHTYKIFVNFINYCDITYMPTLLFNKIPYMIVYDYNVIDTNIIYIDILKMLTDPLRSYFRLEKFMKRFKLLNKDYPLKLSNNVSNNSKISIKAEISDIIKLIFDYIIKSNNFIFIGEIASQIYINKKYKYSSSILELISINIEKDVKEIYAIIFKYCMKNNKIKNFADMVEVEQYYPFFQYWGKKIIIKYNKNPIIILYDNNEKCYPYNDVKLLIFDKEENISIGTFNLVLLYYFYSIMKTIVDNKKNEKEIIQSIIYNMIKTKEEYLKKKNITLFDDSIYKDFIIDCKGKTVDFIRKFHLNRINKKYNSPSLIPSYDPAELKIFDVSKYSYDNISGNIINNPKDKIHINKH